MFGEGGFRVCCSEIVVKGTLNFDCDSMDEGVGLRVGDLGLKLWDSGLPYTLHTKLKKP